MFPQAYEPYKHENIYRFYKDGKRQYRLIKNYVDKVVRGIFKND